MVYFLQFEDFVRNFFAGVELAGSKGTPKRGSTPEQRTNRTEDGEDPTLEVTEDRNRDYS
jgi:hypothetical protein